MKNLKIVSTDGTPQNTKIYCDNIELEHVSRFTFSIDANSPCVEVNLSFLVTEGIDISIPGLNLFTEKDINDVS